MSRETPLRAILNHLQDEEIAYGFMDWWKENHERMEASDDFNHPIDYAAEAWDAAIRSTT